MAEVEADRIPPWQVPVDHWRSVVEEVRAGRRLVPSSWPDGARVAVALSFDSDQETPLLRDGNPTTPGGLAGGDYGSRVAVPRILEILERRQVPASFFVPAVSALLHPSDVAGYVAGGHEVAVHGWIHERNTALTAAEERDLTLRSIDTLERLTGTRPVGIRTPSWDFSPDTLAVIREAGFRYDSSLMADDDPYEILANGEPTGLVEIPVEWIRDDMPYFGFARYGSTRPHSAPGDVLEIWYQEFLGAVREGGVFQLTAHPSIIGHRSRLWIVDELIGRIQATGLAWFTTHADLAHLVASEVTA